MTWVTPVPWVEGTIVTSTFLDQQIKSNLDYLGTTHAHSSGTAGEGAGYLGPVAWLDNLGTAVPAAPTNATILRLIATATNIGYINSDSSTIWFGDTSHEHSIANVAHATADNATGSTAAINLLRRSNNVTTSPTGTMSTSITIGGSGSRSVNLVGGGFLVPNSSGTDDGRAQLNVDGVLQTEVTKEIAGVDGTAWGGEIIHSTLLTNVASGSVTYSYTARMNAGGGVALLGGFIDAREIKQS